MSQGFEGRPGLTRNATGNAPARVRLSDEAIDETLELIAQGHTIADACAAVGISRGGLYSRRTKDPAVAARFARAQTAYRQSLAADVMEKASLTTGYVRMEPVLDHAGNPAVDEDFEPVMRPRLVDYDAQTLGRLINRLIPSADGPNQLNLQINHQIGVGLDETPIDVNDFIASLEGPPQADFLDD